jgi:hypothetical protein
VSGHDPAALGIRIAPVRDVGPSDAMRDGAGALSGILGGVALATAARGDASSTHVAHAVEGCGTGRWGGRAFPVSLASLHALLHSAMTTDAGGDDGGAAAARLPPALQAAAGAALDAGLSIFYPTAAQRRALLTSLVSRGATVDFHLHSPHPGAPGPRSAGDANPPEPQRGEDTGTSKGGCRDVRLDRAIVLLQLECARLGWRCSLVGQLDGASATGQRTAHAHGTRATYASGLHLLMEIPPPHRADKAASVGAPSSHAAPGPGVTFLEEGFARVFARTGLGSWVIPTGCEEPLLPLKIHRVAQFARPGAGSSAEATTAAWTAPQAERDADSNGASGTVHIFPASAGSFDSIRKGVLGEGQPVPAQRVVAAPSVPSMAAADAGSPWPSGGAGHTTKAMRRRFARPHMAFLR